MPGTSLLHLRSLKVKPVSIHRLREGQLLSPHVRVGQAVRGGQIQPGSYPATATWLAQQQVGAGDGAEGGLPDGARTRAATATGDCARGEPR